ERAVLPRRDRHGRGRLRRVVGAPASRRAPPGAAAAAERCARLAHRRRAHARAVGRISARGTHDRGGACARLSAPQARARAQADLRLKSTIIPVREGRFLTTIGKDVPRKAEPSEALRLLFWLRIVAIASQLLVITAVHVGLDIPLPLGPLALP